METVSLPATVHVNSIYDNKLWSPSQSHS